MPLISPRGAPGTPHIAGHHLHANIPSQALVASTPARNAATTIAHTTTAVSDLETSRSAHFCRSCKVPTCMWKSSPSTSPLLSVRSSGEGRVHWGFVEQVVQGEEGGEAEEKIEGR